MAEHKGQNYLHGAAILTLGVIIMKVLGFFYKIPLGNILGDEGYSMFMGAYSIYFIFFTLATAGLPVALSRLVAEADANGRARQEEKTFRVALLTFTALGLLFASVMFFFPNWLAAVYLDGGFEAAVGIIRRALAEDLHPRMLEDHLDAKSRLQEILQRTGEMPRYEFVSMEGPPHAPVFRYRAVTEDRALGEGTGSSKQQAQQEAARDALRKLGRK